MRSRLTVAVVALAAILTCLTGPAQAVVGGEDVTYPWAAALLVPQNGDTPEERQYCSGALIKPDWVLTAAHCNAQRGDVITIGRGRLRSTGGEVRTVDSVEVMPGCSDLTDAMCDVALVRLNEASTQEDLDLAGNSVLSEWGVGTAARAYGYGIEVPPADPMPPSSEHLKRAHVEITSLRTNHRTMWAAGPGNAVCKGDSGGPLIVSTSRGPRIVGIVGRFVGSANECTPGDVASYSKVGYRGSAANSPMYTWIVDTI